MYKLIEKENEWKGKTMMKNEWTLHTKKFGKIKEAKITVSPFMMFVGHNNSGKSYIMQLLWGLLVKAKQYSNAINMQLFKDFKDKILAELKVNDQIELEIDEDFQSLLIEEWNRILNQEKATLIKEVFQHNLEVESLSIHRTSYLPVKINFSMKKSFIEESEAEDSVLRYKLTVNNEIYSSLGVRRKELQGDLIERAIEEIFMLQLRYDYYDYSHRLSLLTGKDSQPIYFPASRTGFLQTYKAIVGNLVDTKEEFLIEEEIRTNRTIEGTTLTRPTFEYLLKLLKLTPSQDKEEKYHTELNFLRKQLLKGEIRKTKTSQFEFMTENKEALPLHVTSSLVSELALLSLFLTSTNKEKLWIIEEIESHLHPSMQVQIARFLMRLTHKDLRIWTTTHSDNIIQVINNMMVLAQKENRQELLRKLQWNDEDIPRDFSDVKLYQFLSTENGTTIEELLLGEGGFEVTTFNDTLDELIQDTVVVQTGGEWNV